MYDTVTGKWVDNITCKVCRMRHPAEWSCQHAKMVADRDRSPPKADEPIDLELLLSAVLAGFQQNHRLSHESADEQVLNHEGLHEPLKEWLRTFSKLWDLTQQTEN